MSRIVIFGAGKIADEAYYYLTNDSKHQVVAFTVDEAFVASTEKLDLPVVPFECVQEKYPPGDFKMFVAVGYQDLNRFRARKCDEARAKGYELISYQCSKASNFGNVPLGENCFVLENTVIQPCSRIGRNVFLWSGNHVGHHASVGDHCYISGQVVISGNAHVGVNCFIGVNATIGHQLTVGAESLIGAGTLVTKDVAPRSVYISPDTPKYRLDSESFLRLTKMR